MYCLVSHEQLLSILNKGTFISTQQNGSIVVPYTLLVNRDANLKELCTRIVQDLDNSTNSDKKDAYTYLDLKVKATPEGADIKGYLNPSILNSDLCLLTTGQTSA